jgi:hypothetical protein
MVFSGSKVLDLRDFLSRSGPLKVLSVDDLGQGAIVIGFAAEDSHLTIRPEASDSEEQWRFFRPYQDSKHLVFGGGFHLE